MATLCAFPGPIFSLAALSRIGFDGIVRRHGAKADIHDIRSFGERIDRNRSIFLVLSPGRHAALSKRDSQNEFEVGLQIVGKRFYEEELELVAEFIGAPSEYLEKYRNPPIKWASTSPTTSELEYWLSHVGSAYPYSPR